MNDNYVNKEDLVNRVANLSGLSKKDAGKAVSATVEAITAAMVAGEKVRLVGFGNFETHTRGARKGRNPQTGADVAIPKSTIPRFSPSKALKSVIPQPTE